MAESQSRSQTDFASTLQHWDKILSFFCIDVVAMTKILPIGI